MKRATIILGSICLLGSFAAGGRIDLAEPGASEEDAERSSAYLDFMEMDQFEFKRAAEEQDGVDYTDVPLPFTEEPLTEEPLTEEPFTDEPLSEEPYPDEARVGEARAFESWGGVRIAPENDAGVVGTRDFEEITAPFDFTSEPPSEDTYWP